MARCQQQLCTTQFIGVDSNPLCGYAMAERSPSLERRLAAILAADVVDYTRLMAEDQERTLESLRLLRTKLLEPVATRRNGNVIKRMGDGWIIEFPSVTDAVACAIEVQEGILNHATIQMRMGMHTGEVVFEVEDVFGDGVNVAARLEKLAEPGQLAISDMVYNSLDRTIAGQFSGGDTHELKNVSRPIRVWCWPKASVVRKQADSGAGKANTDVPLALPDKPSIAVLPFNNMSGDLDQEYFSDGMTEDIITALSKIRWLFVIARNSSFAYKGSSPDVRRVAAELGVRYVLEGSVRKGGNRVRITAQLIDASDGVHVWAERFDREIGDIFALQDDITAALIASIEPELTKAEQQRAITRPAENLDAWSWFQRGLWHHYRATKEDNVKAFRQISKAIELAPNFSRALAALAHVHYWIALFGYTENPKTSLEAGLSLARRAIAADDQEPFGHFALGRICTLLGELDTAIAELELAIELSPSFAHAYYGLGNALNFVGRAEEAIEMIDQALRLNPHDPAIWTFMSGRAWSLIFLGRYDEAHKWAVKGVRQANAGWLSHAIAACTYTETGQPEAAKKAVLNTLKINPDFRVSFVAENYPFRNDVYRDRFIGALRKAGFAE